MADKENYTEVPQNEPADSRTKDHPDSGGVRLEAKMSLLNGTSSNT